MKFSEAIRMGAMLDPQSRSPLGFGFGTTCALAAAAKAIGLKKYHWTRLGDYYPWLNCSSRHPLTEELKSNFEIIYDLNDHCRWTREKIADWVETKESEEAPPQTQEIQEEVVYAHV